MEPIELLRRLLDERGVGSYKHEAPAAVCLAFFDGARWHDCWESVGGEVNVTFSMTPEQAIAATLGPLTERAAKDSERDSDGRGDCRMDYLCDGYLYFKSYWCRGCDERFAYRLIGQKDALPKYCPNCGRKVVSE